MTDSSSILLSRLSAMRHDIHPAMLVVFGICLQTLLAQLLPIRYILLPTALACVYRILYPLLVSLGVLSNAYLKGVNFGASHVTIPKPDGSLPEDTDDPDSGSDRGVVVFVVGWTINHPAGQLAPDVGKMAQYWVNNWDEIEANREKWGFLSRTPVLTTKTENGGLHMLYISYWKDLQHLQAFSVSPSHRSSMAYFRKSARKTPHLGVMHETYVVPKGHWENLYASSAPIGFAQSKYSTSDLGRPDDKKNEYVSSIVKGGGGNAKQNGPGFRRLVAATRAG